MRELRTVCDLCREPAVHLQVPVAIGLKKRREVKGRLDLCARCYKELLQPVIDVLKQHGQQKPPARPQRGRKRQLGPYLCRAGCASAPLKSQTTLTQHLLNIHDGMTMEEYVEQHGEPVPLTPEEVAELVVEARCPEQGCDTVYSTARGHRWPQAALISHMWGHHGIKWKPGQT